MTNTGHNEATMGSAEQNERAFGRMLEQLDAFAGDLCGKAWHDNRVPDVELARVIKSSTTKQGIFNKDAYEVETLEFTGKKLPSGDPDRPVHSIFTVAQTRSTPIRLGSIDESHIPGLFGHFMDTFPILVDDSMQTHVPSEQFEPTDDETETDSFPLGSILQLMLCAEVLEKMGLDIRLGHTILYTIKEVSGSIEYIESSAYEIGPTAYEVSRFDSTDNGLKAAHHKDKNGLDEELYSAPEIDPQAHAIETPASDTGEHITMGDEFQSIVSVSFGEEDHAGIDHGTHVKNILKIMKALKKKKS